MTGRRPNVPSAPTRVAERLLRSIAINEAGCWLTGYALTRNGYVKVGWSEKGRKQTSSGHLIAYEYTHGRVPEGLELDHLCRNRACVNPAHLEPVVTAENLARSPLAPAAINAQKTHCPQGHPYDEANTYIHTASGRMCKTCMAERQRRRRAEQPRKPRKRQAACRRGHPFDEANTRINGRGSRSCRACERIASREHQRRRRAANKAGATS